MENHWSYYTDITDHEHNIFQEAVGDNIHYYQPLSVAYIDSLRYRFIANTAKSPSLPTRFVMIEIYKPRFGIAYITKIHPIDINP